MTNTPVKLGTRKAKGTPNIFGTDIWFQGEDDLLWVMPLDDPSKAVNPQGLKTMSTPQPSDDGYVYFQGEGNKLIAIQQHFPYLYTNLGNCECWEVPVVPKDGFVYFRNGAGKLSRISLDRADNFAVENYNFSTAFAPAVHVDHNVSYLFYADGSDRALQRLDLDRPADGASDFGTYTLGDTPFVGANGKLYIVDSKHDAYEIDPGNSASATKIASNVRSTPVTSEFGDDGNVYWRAIGDALYMAPRSNPSNTTQLGTTDAWPDPQGDGYVVFVGDDEYIYRVSTTA